MNKIVVLLLYAASLSWGNAQAVPDSISHYTPYNIVALPPGTPEWMAALEHPEKVNYHEVTAHFEQFLRENPSYRKKTPFNKPLLNHFRRWQKAYAPYVQPDGSIKLPRQKEFVTMVDDINAQSNKGLRRSRTTVAAQDKWEVLAPIVTYDYQTKKVTPWQANIQRFDVAPSDPNILYCGTETGMVFKSVDKGLHWLPATADHYFGGEVTTIEVSRTDANKVVVGAGPLVWITNDGGKTWKNITPPELRHVFKRVRDVVFRPDNDNVLLLATDAGIYNSEDAGGTWKKVEGEQCFDLKVKHGDPSVVYALVRQGYDVVFRKSTDGGCTFVSKNFGFSSRLASGRIGLSEAPGGREYVYVFACCADASQSYSMPFYLGTPVLFKSVDAGEHWNANTEMVNQMESLDRNGGQGYYDMVVQASPEDPETLLFGLLHLYRSTDGGKTIKNMGGYYGVFDLHCDMQDLKVVRGDTWLSTDGGMIYSPDFFAKKAETRINGIYASEFWGFDQGWNEDVMVGGRNHNGNMSQLGCYNGVTISMGGSERATGYIFLSNPRKITFSDGRPHFMPDDWREEFVPFSGFWTYPYESAQYGLGFVFDPRYAKSFYIHQQSDTHKLWKTVNDGESFVELYHFKEPISGYDVSRSNPDKIVVGTSAHIYRSTDGGTTFEPYADLPKELSNTNLYKVAIHPRNEQEIWITTHDNGGLFRTQDDGKTWQRMDEGLNVGGTTEKYLINRFFLTGNDKNAVYAVASVWRQFTETSKTYRSRVLYRDDTTNGWQDFSEGLPPVITVNRLLPFYKEGKIRIATNNGIWQRSLVDAEFRPVAQPLILNAGTGENKGEADLEFDSFSIVNQQNAEWLWSFNPTPLSVSDTKVRNPKVRVESEQSYDVTLTITTPAGKDTKTIQKMIVGRKDVPTAIVGQEVLRRDIDLASTAVRLGTSFSFTARGLKHSVSITLYDVSGKNVRQEWLNPGETCKISTLGLSPGVYLYHCKNENFQKSGRLLVQ